MLMQYRLLLILFAMFSPLFSEEKKKMLTKNTIFPLFSARGAYKIEKWHCLFYLLISAPCSMSDNKYSTENIVKHKMLNRKW